ncbi:WXG100 family type VII secretion target [Actinokineospora diospyrosa]|uniref:Outer membrane channel protein CpnT-like N-terminal domain-containing protein n=1 Tax=Actinokineospora diospyrosa TaxID=103728 RepID=A0ABT1ID52_9PSEU|nr:WXG100 family type VII secretion target [Actinokineospora diospyrosa]MCP2270564.1 hypothetical protein [Actinokineospora diospyrosa]
MTGFDVNGGALLAHSAGSASQGDNFASLAHLLEQAGVSHDCFGPLFFFFENTYTETLRECQGMANKAAGYLREISTAVADTATSYGATEADNTTGLASIEGPTIGSLGELEGAGAATRKTDFQQASAYGSSWAENSYKVADQVKDPGDPPEMAFAAFNARMEQIQTVMSPGQAFIDNGLGWLISIVISPLVNLVLEPALGDPEQMRATAKGWEKVTDWLDKVGDREEARASATGDAWQGEAADAFRTEMTEFADGARALGGDIAGLTSVLETAADIFDTFVQVVVDIIQELVLGLIIEWLAALAASWITFGSSTAVATGLTASQVAITSSRLGKQVAQQAQRLKPLFTQLEDLLKLVRGGKLSKVMDVASQQRGAMVGRRVLGSNPITKSAASFDNMRDATKAKDKAQAVLDKAIDSGDAKKIEKAREGLSDAETRVDNATARRTVSGHNVFGKAATGEQALAQQAVQAGLGYLGLSGTTTVGTAVVRGTLENVPGAALEWGVGQAYDYAEDPSTEEERKAAQERGFS